MHTAEINGLCHLKFCLLWELHQPITVHLEQAFSLHTTETTATNSVMSMLAFPSFLYRYYLNFGTHKQVEVRYFSPPNFPFCDVHLKINCSTFLPSYSKAMGAADCKPMLSSSDFSSCHLRRTWLFLMAGLFCFRQNPVG